MARRGDRQDAGERRAERRLGREDDAMTLANWLTLIGGMLLLVGVVIALVANHYETKSPTTTRRK